MTSREFVKSPTITYKIFFCGSWMKWFSLFIFFCTAQLHAQISVEDVSLATRLDVESFDTSELIKVGEGTFFDYFRFLDGSDRGILMPKRDQSFSAPHSSNFGSMIRSSTVASDAASSIFDKVDQLFLLTRFRGPQVLGLAKVDEFGTQYLGILVENVPGERPALDIENSHARDEYIELFLEMMEAGFIPLDFHLGNVRYVFKDRRMRPIDVMPRTNLDLFFRDSQRPPLRNFRLLQLGQTIVTVEKEFPRQHPGLKACRELISSMRAVMPEVDRYVGSVLKERAGRVMVAQPINP